MSKGTLEDIKYIFIFSLTAGLGFVVSEGIAGYIGKIIKNLLS